LKYSEKETESQLRHRAELVQFWDVADGDHVLEVGCGQGEMSVVLADAVGPYGKVLAVDNAPANYGSPISIGDAHKKIKSSAIGERIDFRISTDLLNPSETFHDECFDFAVFCHSSWYISLSQELQKLFSRIRPWARCLAYAEWDLRPGHVNQTAHMAAVLLQLYVQSIWSQQDSSGLAGNIRSLILPEEARLYAENADWQLTKEKTIDTSMQLGYGTSWELNKALKMAKEICAAKEIMLSEYVRATISSKKKLLCELANNAEIQSLSTYAFLAA